MYKRHFSPTPSIVLPDSSDMDQNSRKVSKTDSESRPGICTCMVDDLISAVNYSVDPKDQEQTILSILHDRYLSDLIYTRVGSALVAINPYRRISGLYSHAAMNAVRSGYEINDTARSESIAHIFGIAEEAFQSLSASKSENFNQTLVITGESGSGKTESTKLVVEYLTQRCSVTSSGRLRCRLSGSMETLTQSPWRQQQQIIDSNPILEAFGNARTGKNDNSSRFGKYIDLEIENHGSGMVMTGARITHYLLERSRITAPQNRIERNYHIFYFLQAGANDLLKEKLKLKDTNGPFEYARMDFGATDYSSERKGWRQLQDAFSVLEFTPNTCQSIYRLIGAILHLGQIKFDKRFIKNSDNGSVVSDLKPVKIVAELMNLSSTECLVDAFTHKTLSLQRPAFVNMDTIQRCLQAHQASNVRDSFSRGLYNRLFVWIVNRINRILENKTSKRRCLQNIRHIGILDIFGFEEVEWFDTISDHKLCSPLNAACGFEQFCINYANERLHRFFIHVTLELQQKTYENEGILWRKINYEDNQRILDVIADGKINLISLINEETIFPQGNDSNLLLKIQNFHGQEGKDAVVNVLNKHASDGRDMFSIKHYAGEIVYNTEGFVEKNRDDFNVDLLNLVDDHCENQFIRLLFEPYDFDRKRKSKTIVSNFQCSLENLMNVMSNSTARFVRCLRPNRHKSARCFDSNLVLKQIRYSALLETIKVQHSGYPIKLEFSEFTKRFDALVPTTSTHRPNYRSMAAGLMMMLIKAIGGSSSWDMQLGKTVVFIKAKYFSKMVDWYKDFFTLRLRSILNTLHTRSKVEELTRISKSINQLQQCISQRKTQRKTIRFCLRLSSIIKSTIMTRKSMSSKNYRRLKRAASVPNRSANFSNLPVPQCNVLTSTNTMKKDTERENNDGILTAMLWNSVQFDERYQLDDVIAFHRKLLAHIFRTNSINSAYEHLINLVRHNCTYLATLCSILAVYPPNEPKTQDKVMELILSMRNKFLRSNRWVHIASHRLHRAVNQCGVQRSTIPTIWEMNELWASESCEIPIWTMSNIRYELTVDSLSTCNEMIDKICDFVGLRDRFGFSIFIAFENQNVNSTETSTNRDFSLPRLVCLNSDAEMDHCSAYFFDVLAKYSSFINWRLYLRKEVFSPWHDSTTDSIATELIFDQIYEGLRCRSRHPFQPEYQLKDNEKFAGLLAKIVLVKFPNTDHYEEKLKTIFMHGISDEFVESFVDQIEIQRCVSIGTLKNEVVNFAFRQWPTYFSRVFWCRRLGSQKRIAALVNWTGLLLMDEHFEDSLQQGTNDETKHAPFAEMLTIGIRTEKATSEISRRYILSVSLIHQGEIQLSCNERIAKSLHFILEWFLEGLRKRSKYCIALQQFRNEFNRGDLLTIVSDPSPWHNSLIVKKEKKHIKLPSIDFPIHIIPTVSTLILIHSIFFKKKEHFLVFLSC